MAFLQSLDKWAHLPVVAGIPWISHAYWREQIVWKSSSKKQKRCVAEELNLVEPIQIPFSAEKGENDEV